MCTVYNSITTTFQLYHYDSPGGMLSGDTRVRPPSFASVNDPISLILNLNGHKQVFIPYKTVVSGGCLILMALFLCHDLHCTYVFRALETQCGRNHSHDHEHTAICAYLCFVCCMVSPSWPSSCCNCQQMGILSIRTMVKKNGGDHQIQDEYGWISDLPNCPTLSHPETQGHRTFRQNEANPAAPASVVLRLHALCIVTRELIRVLIHILDPCWTQIPGSWSLLCHLIWP